MLNALFGGKFGAKKPNDTIDERNDEMSTSGRKGGSKRVRRLTE